MEHYKLFPTHLFVFDDFYKQDVGDMKTYISNLWKKRDFDNNWQTKSADLQKKVEFADFAKEIITTNKTILGKVLKYYVEDIVITDMWANVLKPGESHSPHTHSNNYLSGVYYLYSDEEMQRADQKVAYLNTVVKYLEQILRNINNRTFLIKNMIEWKKFTSGAI